MDIVNVLGIPKDVVKGSALISLVGQNKVYIENFKNIIDYNCERIRIKAKNGIIDVIGSDLQIERYNNTEIIIIGFIKEVKYV